MLAGYLLCPVLPVQDHSMPDSWHEQGPGPSFGFLWPAHFPDLTHTKNMKTKPPKIKERNGARYGAIDCKNGSMQAAVKK